MTDDLLVIKIGGGETLDDAALWDDLATLHEQGHRFVLVHGGNAALTALQERLGTPARFVQNTKGAVSRYTDGEGIRQFAMVYAGDRNVAHVCGLRARGVNALGLTGVDGGLLVGERRSTIRGIEDGKKKVLRDDHTGTITGVNGDLLHLLLGQGYVPVVTVPAYAEGPDGASGVPINVDGDTAAERIATALGATTLLYLSDVPGLLLDPADPGSLVRTVRSGTEWLHAEAAAGGRFRRKIQAVRSAVDSGVHTVVIASGAVAAPVTGALGGGGTHFRASSERIEEVRT